MKTKKEILAMTKEELLEERDNLTEKDNSNSNSNCYGCYGCINCYDCSNCINCINCRYCINCSDCSNCSNCYNCYMCKNLNDGNKHEFLICNVQLTEEEYKKKMEEL